MDIIKYMGKLSKCDFLDYSKLQGISGANLGIPFNIVGVRATAKAIKDGLSAIEGTLFFLINPKVVEESKETYIVMSNCGSIRLPKKIKVERHEWVKVGYYDLTGAPKEDVFKGAFGSTLQHEIEHNLGILITDKEETGNDEEKSN